MKPTGGACLWVAYTNVCCCIVGGTNTGIDSTKYFVIGGADGGVCVDGWAGIRRIVVRHP
jgi:hypothetical protein